MDTASRRSPLTVGNNSRWLLLILTLGLSTRAAIIVYADRRPAMFDFPDTRRYLAVARNLAAGRGPMESETARAGTDPLYPALLSVGILAGLDTDDQLVRFGRLINTLAGVASIALVASMAGRIAGPRGGLIAALIMAIDPMMNFFNALVLTETCYIMLLLAAAAALFRYSESGTMVAIVAAGLFFGLATLTRSTSLLLPLFFLPIIWFMRAAPPVRRAVATTALLASVAVILVPVSLRNYRLFGHAVPVRTGGGASLMEALGPWADGGPGMNRIIYPDLPENANEYEKDRVCREAAIDWARQNPSPVLSLAAAKLRRTWSIGVNAVDYSSPFFRAVAWLSVAPVYVLAVFGAWHMRRQRIVLGLLLAPAVYFSLVHMIFVGSVRYRLPAMPLLFILAGVALSRLRRKHRADESYDCLL
jgi:hypothetical protein